MRAKFVLSNGCAEDLRQAFSAFGHIRRHSGQRLELPLSSDRDANAATIDNSGRTGWSPQRI
jgi:hypothetical protein